MSKASEQSSEDSLSKPSFLASHIGGKLARELKAADMNSPQTAIYWVRSFRNVRLKASNIGGKLACEVKVKAADMNNLQAVIY